MDGKYQQYFIFYIVLLKNNAKVKSTLAQDKKKSVEISEACKEEKGFENPTLREHI